MAQTQPHYTSDDFPRTMRRIRPPRKRFIYLVITLLVLYFLSKKLFWSSADSVSPLPEAGNKKQALFAKKRDPKELQEKIVEAVGDSWLNYSVMVESYTETFSMSISDTEIYTAASVNKVPILAALYYYAQKGDIDLDRTITLQSQDIQDYGTGSIRYASPGTTYSIKTLAKLMGKQSDNTAAYILSNHIIGIDKLQEALAMWGLSQTDIINNKTSNKDISLLFRLMFQEKVTNHAYTQEMLSFLKDTDFEMRLPAQLPAGTNVYHKIGTEVGVIHDVGLVTDGTVTYYIGVFTADTPETPETDALIAKVSKVVFDYLH